MCEYIICNYHRTHVEYGIHVGVIASAIAWGRQSQ